MKTQPPVDKNCHFCQNKISAVDYKNLQLLKKFMSPHAKIMGRKKTGSCAAHQRMITQALKRARHMALMPFVSV
jgi:small subunit ribosomal protein S18